MVGFLLYGFDFVRTIITDARSTEFFDDPLVVVSFVSRFGFRQSSLYFSRVPTRSRS